MLIVPFILQVVTIVGLVGYLSYRNGQRSVEDLTNQLMDRVSNQVQAKLDNYLEVPLLANKINRDTFRLGTIPFVLDQPNPQLDRYLYQQMQRFPSLAWISLGGEENGDSVGIWRPGENEPLQISTSSLKTQYFGNYYQLNEQGDRTKLLKIEKPAFHPRTRPWYKGAIVANGPTWTPIYAGFTPGTVFIASSEPMYNSAGKLVGVSGIDLSLNGIQRFLEQNPVSQTGQIFLMERSGLLVASSAQEAPFEIREGQPPIRVNALTSKTPLIQATAQELQTRVKHFDWIKTPQTFYHNHGGIDGSSNHGSGGEFIHVLPFSKAPGLDWLIVIVVPEADVMGQIQAGNQTTALFSIVGVLAMILLNVLISRRLVKPLQELSQASQRIIQGRFDSPLHDSRILELSDLSGSFSQMSREIEHSRRALEAYSRSLEEKVNERTQALQAEMKRRTEAEAELQAANQALKRRAYIDNLTQLPNRRQFDERLLQDWSRLTRYRVPLSLIICDIDYFNQYQATYGDLGSEECLCAIAQILSATASRPYDLVARYSSEEFVLLLPNTPLPGAIGVATAIQDQVKALQIRNPGSQVSEFVTLSFGVASIIPTTTTTPEEFLVRTDCELYRAKHEGHDRISSATWG
jgi:diguanylate cyclase (GGDEF)-like protein